MKAAIALLMLFAGSHAFAGGVRIDPALIDNGVYVQPISRGE
jgi:hypothetical protein